MKTTTFKASTNGAAKVPNLNLVATAEFPPHETLEIATKRHQAEALKIVDALFESLPGGTVDQIFIELARRNASVLRVRYENQVKAKGSK